MNATNRKMSVSESAIFNDLLDALDEDLPAAPDAAAVRLERNVPTREDHDDRPDRAGERRVVVLDDAHPGGG
jgi:hypothetical protein